MGKKSREKWERRQREIRWQSTESTHFAQGVRRIAQSGEFLTLPISYHMSSSPPSKLTVRRNVERGGYDVTIMLEGRVSHYFVEEEDVEI